VIKVDLSPGSTRDSGDKSDEKQTTKSHSSVRPGRVEPRRIKRNDGHYPYLVLVQRELDKSLLPLRDNLSFGKEVFLGITKL